MSKVLSIAKKDIVSTFRNKMALVFMALFPLVFMLLLGFTFGGENIASVKVSVYDADNGEISIGFVNALSGTDLPPANRSDWVFRVTVVDSDAEGRWLVGNGSVNAYVQIPQGFSHNLTNGNQTYTNVIYDNANPSQAEVTRGAIRGFVQSFTERFIEARLEYMLPYLEAASNATGTPVETMLIYVQEFHEPVLINENLSLRKEMRYVDWLIPGMIGIAVLWIGVTQSTGAIAREKDSGTLNRILLTPTGPWPVLIGKTLGCMFNTLLSVAIAAVAGILIFNVTLSGNIPLAVLVLILGALSSIGFGLIFSSVAKNRDAAQNIAVVFSLPVQFLSGLFFSLEMMPEFMQFISKFLPFTYCIDSLRDILIRQASWSAVASNVLILAVYSIALYVVGALVYKKTVTK